MGKFIQLAEDVFTRWKNCMAALAIQNDSEMADFLLNRLVSDRFRELSQRDSREGTPSPVHSDSGASGKDLASPPLPHQPPSTQVPLPQPAAHSPAAEGRSPTRSPTAEGRSLTQSPTAATTNPGHAAMDKGYGQTPSPGQQASQTSDFSEYKHKLERRKRKPVIENVDGSIKVAKTASETKKGSSHMPPRDSALGKASENVVPVGGVSSVSTIQAAHIPLSAEREDALRLQANRKRQEVIVTPQSLPRQATEAFHGTCGEEAIDLSVRPSKDLFLAGVRKEHLVRPKSCSPSGKDNSLDPHAQYQSGLGSRRAYAGVYDSSDLSDGSQQCVSPQPRFSSNKGSSNDSGSDYDCCSASPGDSSQQNKLAVEEQDNARSSPRPGGNIGGIESIVQRLHQVKSETPSRSDSEDESDYYAVTFKELIARTISRCDHYGSSKSQLRGKRKRGSKTTSEHNAARREEILAAKKLLERVSKKKRETFKLTVNCSTDGSEHVRNAAASEAIATLVRSVWHKENPKPIGQVIKEMVAKKLAGQEGEGDDGRDPSKRKGPMTIKDILSSRNDNVIEDCERMSDRGRKELSDDLDKKEAEKESDLNLSAAEALRKMAKNNERRECDENQADPGRPQQVNHKSQSLENTKGGQPISDKHSIERVQSDDVSDDDEDDQIVDLDQKKKAKRRSKKKSRRWVHMFAKGSEGGELNEAPIGDSDDSNDQVYEASAPVALTSHSAIREVLQLPREAVDTRSVLHPVVQSLDQDQDDDEDEEIDVMDTKDIPILKQQTLPDQTATPQRELTKSPPISSKDPPKSNIISHSISQILDQKSDASPIESRVRSSSAIASSIPPVLQHGALTEAQVCYRSPIDDESPVEPEASANPLAPEGTGSSGGGAEEGMGEINNINTATDFLIRFALRQNDGSREGTVETQ